MPADAPTIVATSGGWVPGHRTRLAFGPLLHHCLDLSGAHGRTPRVTVLHTAGGDQAHWQQWASEAGRAAGVDLTNLALFPMPSVDDAPGHLHDADVVWVNGGSVVNLLAVWRAHGLDRVFRDVWQAGVVLGGVSAGSICWHTGGTTDSFGPDLDPVTDALGLLPYANGVHYDSEERRRPLVHALVGDGTLGRTYCTDDGVGLVYRGTALVEAVAERPGAGAYVVERGPDGTAVEEPLDVRRLPA
ncbi:Type 1 glutamine amidotransferase-like domain-containing protein [Aquipuribacter nitratireducens]|uniref:Type 1 glutamine amidotransferase-like domain-containing protein n=1 Tax=Aquipuribacter nitratireducens TaxID=650104 RepID=A0ABW0GIW3_9MICO